MIYTVHYLYYSMKYCHDENYKYYALYQRFNVHVTSYEREFHEIHVIYIAWIFIQIFDDKTSFKHIFLSNSKSLITEHQLCFQQQLNQSSKVVNTHLFDLPKDHRHRVSRDLWF